MSRGASPEMSHVGRCHRRTGSSSHAAPAHAHRRRWQEPALGRWSHWVPTRQSVAVRRGTFPGVVKRAHAEKLEDRVAVPLPGASVPVVLMAAAPPRGGELLARAEARPRRPATSRASCWSARSSSATAAPGRRPRARHLGRRRRGHRAGRRGSRARPRPWSTASSSPPRPATSRASRWSAVALPGGSSRRAGPVRADHRRSGQSVISTSRPVLGSMKNTRAPTSSRGRRSRRAIHSSRNTMRTVSTGRPSRSCLALTSARTS